MAWSLLALAAMMPGSAAAVNYNGTVSTGVGDIHPFESDAPGTYTASVRGFAQTTTSAENGTTNSARASAASVDSGTQYGIATSRITYNFQLMGPTTFVYIPVRVQANGYAGGSGEQFNAQSSFRIDNIFESVEVGSTACNGVCGTYNAWTFDDIVYAPANRDVLVTTIAYATAGLFGRGGSAFAFVDPIFTIDPAYADSYTIVGVPGAAMPPVNGVPEPASWAMMLVGFGAVGGAVRNRTRNGVWRARGVRLPVPADL